MKIRLVERLGRVLMKLDAVDIVIVDDEAAYFNEKMLLAARNAGYGRIRRIYSVDSDLLASFYKHPPDIFILDVKGITTKDVAKDGLALAANLRKTTSSYIAVTSAHRYHLTNRLTYVDYVIEDRLLTVVDFVDQLRLIVEDCVTTRKRFYQKLALRTGLYLTKASLTGHIISG